MYSDAEANASSAISRVTALERTVITLNATVVALAAVVSGLGTTVPAQSSFKIICPDDGKTYPLTIRNVAGQISTQIGDGI